MTHDPTQTQSTEHARHSQELSLQRTAPPLAIPGYEPRKFLGSGAYGEVWVALDQNTGRRVAIKFYTRGGQLDWSQLSREVEKLVFLSADRYVVQLLDVGWNAQPPYFVMEYIEKGSLEDYLEENGPMPVGEAVEMFRSIATGLARAHGKGVLHCDLKPANILLDQDHHPRLADFGQARLSHEQAPALGTLFYMAPEQADLHAIADARWDVYALGAVLHCLLTGQPPFRSEGAISGIDATPDLDARLQHYRHLIETAPPLDEVRRVAGIDRSLCEILERCLAADPDERFPNVQSVLDALARRDQQRDRRPLILLGLVGPLLFLVVTALFTWRSHQQSVDSADRLLLERVQQSNGFAADFVREAVARRIESYFREVEQLANDPELVGQLESFVDRPDINEILDSLRSTHAASDAALRTIIKNDPQRQSIQQRMEQALRNPARPEIASWFITDYRGIHIGAAFDKPTDVSTIGVDYSYRPYFHGGPLDERPTDGHHLEQTHLSSVFQSTATGTWKVAISTPILRDGHFLGIVALTVELGRLGEVLGSRARPEQFHVLVDGRDGPSRGVILQHPLFAEILGRHGTLDPRFSTDPRYRVDLAKLDSIPQYRDPLGMHPQGEVYRRQWIAAHRPVVLERAESNAAASSPETRSIATGLEVLVQEDYDVAAGPVHQLGRSLLRQGVVALASVVGLVGLLWYSVARALADPHDAARRRKGPRAKPTTLHSMETVELPPALRRETPPRREDSPPRGTQPTERSPS